MNTPMLDNKPRQRPRNRLKEVRAAKRVTAAECAREITTATGKTCTPQNIYQVEAGKWDLSVDKWLALARFLGTTVEALKGAPS